MSRIYTMLYEDDAWSEFVLSKVGLMIACAIVIAAISHMTYSFWSLNQENELDTIALKLKHTIEKTSSIKEGDSSGHSFHLHDLVYGSSIDPNMIKAYIGHNYIKVEIERDDRTISTVKPLVFNVITLNESELHKNLHGEFASTGRIDGALNENPEVVLDFIAQLAQQEIQLNTSKEVYIVKDFTYIQYDSEVFRLEHILLYQ